VPEPSFSLLVTGGAGFIGSNFVLDAVLRRGLRVVNLDRLTYAGNLDNLEEVAGHAHHVFVHGDVCDRSLLRRLLSEHRPRAIVHLAAETHVDRSIDSPGEFVRTNVVGAFELLEAARAHLGTLPAGEAGVFRVLLVSTDEVFGSLGETGFFTESRPLAPSSPYAASKASVDHLARAYFRTYGLPVLTTNCSNNYGRFQFPEKLVPLMILNALEGRPLPVYGDGGHVRDWLHVQDHVEALHAVLERGRTGETYVVGGRNARTNLEVVHMVCDVLDAEIPGPTGSYRDLVTFVDDRPGHDRRYAIEPSKIEGELGWHARHTFEDGLRETVRWYLDHREWCARITEGRYRRERLGKP
jgi:dTDP-glucose 4,6-dehydratase